LIEALKKSKRAMVFSFVASLKNSYDMKGMISAGLVFGKVCQGVLARSGQLFADKKPTVLGAGPCNNCEKCAILTKEPCRYPDQAITSLEACGVDVSQLAKLSGLKYNAGAGTITYFGAVFL
jgi:predicted metal-binding protein